jgi:4-hydroxy-tetrahydrodipicolinate reductase
VRVLTLGTGQMGAGIARAVLGTPGFELAGAWARRSERAGLDLGEAIGLGRRVGLTIHGDLAQAVAESRPQVAIQATCSRLGDAATELEPLLAAGVACVSIAEELAWPAAASPELAGRLDAAARRGGAALLGTGVNPGFVLDLLPVVLSGVCAEVRRIEATRVNDLSPYGPTVLTSQGVGLTPAGFRGGVADGSVVGHFGFPQSIAMIADALGWEVERIEEQREPIVSTVARETPFASVRPGQVAGCHHTAVAWVAGQRAIVLDHPQQIRPELAGVATGDRIEIAGAPGVCLAGSPEIPGGAATVALAVNAVPRVLAAAPGLHSMLDMPPLAALPRAETSVPPPHAGREAAR